MSAGTAAGTGAAAGDVCAACGAEPWEEAVKEAGGAVCGASVWLTGTWACAAPGGTEAAGAVLAGAETALTEAWAALLLVAESSATRSASEGPFVLPAGAPKAPAGWAVPVSPRAATFSRPKEEEPPPEGAETVPAVSGPPGVNTVGGEAELEFTGVCPAAPASPGAGRGARRASVSLRLSRKGGTRVSGAAGAASPVCPSGAGELCRGGAAAGAGDVSAPAGTPRAAGWGEEVPACAVAPGCSVAGGVPASGIAAGAGAAAGLAASPGSRPEWVCGNAASAGAAGAAFSAATRGGTGLWLPEGSAARAAEAGLFGSIDPSPASGGNSVTGDFPVGFQRAPRALGKKSMETVEGVCVETTKPNSGVLVIKTRERPSWRVPRKILDSGGAFCISRPGGTWLKGISTPCRSMRPTVPAMPSAGSMLMVTRSRSCREDQRKVAADPSPGASRPRSRAAQRYRKNQERVRCITCSSCKIHTQQQNLRRKSSSPAIPCSSFSVFR